MITVQRVEIKDGPQPIYRVVEFRGCGLGGLYIIDVRKAAGWAVLWAFLRTDPANLPIEFEITIFS